MFPSLGDTYNFSSYKDELIWAMSADPRPAWPPLSAAA